MGKTNWLDIYKNISIIQTHSSGGYIMNSDEAKKKYIDEVSFHLTIETIKIFDEKTRLLSDADKLRFIDAMNLQVPKHDNSSRIESDNARFLAEFNFFEFIDQLKSELMKFNEEKSRSKLSISQIALKMVYEGNIINRNTADDVAKENGYKSGEKLYQKFMQYSSRANRTGFSTPKKVKYKIQLIESVISILPSEKQELAKDELNILKNIQDSEIL
jgi:hypothetical protein